jgi:iron complex transport system substrate-binding protein
VPRLVDFRREHLDRIRRTVAASPNRRRPVVFLEAHAGMSSECCNSPGRGNVGEYIELAGGNNIGADVLPGSSGRLNLEYVISRAPEVYIGTGGPHLAKAGGLVIGPESTPQATSAALRRLIARPGFQVIRAVRDRRVYALSHQLLNSPLDLLAAEALAVWINPELFRDLDPAATLAEMNRRFLPVPMSGTWWLELN